ncbi:MAG: hypothetical protein Q9P14_13700 [candidate division KSB1 bacterium]|nr:hypothetical protein [candidate division KSB1 bacterium]
MTFLSFPSLAWEGEKVEKGIIADVDESLLKSRPESHGTVLKLFKICPMSLTANADKTRSTRIVFRCGEGRK